MYQRKEFFGQLSFKRRAFDTPAGTHPSDIMYLTEALYVPALYTPCIGQERQKNGVKTLHGRGAAEIGTCIYSA